MRTLLALLVIAAPLHAQAPKFPPAKVLPPDAAALKAIADKTAELGKAIEKLRPDENRHDYRADVEIFHNAALNIVEHKEFFHSNSAAWTLDILDKGLTRAQAIAKKDYSWAAVPGKTVVRGYRSKIDGTAQPYAVTFPTSFGKTDKKFRTDVVLHGRDGTYTEVKFLKTNGDRKTVDNHFVQIDIAGRGNNAYRWAGEADVFEAMGDFEGGSRLASVPDPLFFTDLRRVVLRGFSMGGAGTWHLGLHHPMRWCVMSPGAGFTTTRGYIGDLPAQLPSYQEACLKIYDAVDYAENAFNIPIVAYSGGKDPQKKAADNIEARLKTLGLSMVHLIAPDEAHRFPAEYVKKADALWSQHADKGRPEYPPEVRFTTYTTKYGGCDWVWIQGLERHYEKAEVHAKRVTGGFEVKTQNVSELHLRLEKLTSDKVTVRIDGQKVIIAPSEKTRNTYSFLLVKKHNQWEQLTYAQAELDIEKTPRKRHNLQGPIDDAFTYTFLCVRGTGKPWHEATQKYADADLARFQYEWSKFMRGKLVIKNDVDVTEKEIFWNRLILFGDPGSNSLIAKVLKDLPLTWTEKEIAFAGQTVASKDHVPVMIFPNPLNKGRYVVLNSGHTFHAKEFMGTNAQLYPRLGDFALLKLAGTANDPLRVDVVTAGLFDEQWRMPNPRKE